MAGEPWRRLPRRRLGARRETVAAIAAAGLAALGCTRTDIAAQDVHNGPGATSAQNAVADPTLPGGLRGSVVVDDTTIGPLRDSLTTALDLNGRAGHLMLTFNPATVPAGCVAGDDRICFRAFREPPAQLSDWINFLPGFTTFTMDASRVAVGNNSTGIVTALTAAFAGGGVDLSVIQANGIADTSDPLEQLARILDSPDVEMRIAFGAAKLHLEGRDGTVGLWIPATLNFTSNFGVNECHETSSIIVPADGTLGPTLCQEIKEGINHGMDSALGNLNLGYDTNFHCKNIDIYTKVRKVRLWIGLIPRLREGCLPTGANQDIRFMENVPGGAFYPQGCMDIAPEVKADLQVSSNLDSSGADVSINVVPTGCTNDVTFWCDAAFVASAGQFRCFPDKANDIAAGKLEEQLIPKLEDTLRQRLETYLHYSGAGASPLNWPSPGPGCQSTTAACAALIRDHFIPGSLTALAYGWYAKAFGNFPVSKFSSDQSCPPPSGLNVYQYVSPRGKADTCASCPPFCLYDTESDECNCGLFHTGPATAPSGHAITFDYVVDGDNDDIPENEDNCPGVVSDQTDGDGDGVGDPCDPCPCDIGNGDPDGDGICNNLECGAPGDNCPNVANGGQENCNRDSELAHGAVVFGDACDPVVCPGFAPVFATSSSIKSGDVTYATALVQIKFSPIGSHDIAAVASTEVSVPVTKTHYRFCPHDPTRGADCFNDAVAVRDALLTLPDDSLATLFHRITFTSLGTGIPEGSRTYGTGNSYTRTWLYKDDYKTWRGTSWGSWLPDVETALTDPGAASPFDAAGRFWAHGDSGVGTTDLSLGTGMHGLASNPSQPASQLVNHYERLSPLTILTIPNYADIVPIGVIRDCWVCGPVFGKNYCTFCSVEAKPQIVLPASRIIAQSDDGTIGVVSVGGTLKPLSAPLGPGLRSSIARGLTWVDQAEPSALWGLGANAPAAIAVSGTIIEDLVFSANGEVFDRRDLGLVDRRETHAPVASKTTRSDSLPVYSRATGRVFFLGGLDASGNPAKDVVVRDVFGGLPTVIPPGGWDPGKILAATYSPFEDVLWVLDEIAGPAKAQSTRRLWLLSPRSGVGSIMGSWTSAGRFDRHWLRLDRDGSVLLFASGKTLRHHAVVRLNHRAGLLEVLGVAFRQGDLAIPPVVDMSGYWLVHRVAPQKSTTVERLETLDLRQPEKFSLAECL
jgi:hypothetical protein